MSLLPDSLRRLGADENTDPNVLPKWEALERSFTKEVEELLGGLDRLRFLDIDGLSDEDFDRVADWLAWQWHLTGTEGWTAARKTWRKA